MSNLLTRIARDDRGEASGPGSVRGHFALKSNNARVAQPDQPARQGFEL